MGKFPVYANFVRLTDVEIRRLRAEVNELQAKVAEQRAEIEQVTEVLRKGLEIDTEDNSACG